MWHFVSIIDSINFTSYCDNLRRVISQFSNGLACDSILTLQETRACFHSPRPPSAQQKRPVLKTEVAGSSKTAIPKRFCPRNPFVFEKISMDSHILPEVHVRSVRLMCSQIKNFSLRSDFRQPRMHTSSICNSVLHDLTLNKMTVVCFVGTVCLLTVIRNKTHHQSKNFRYYL